MPLADQPGFLAQSIYLIVICAAPLILAALAIVVFRRRNLPRAKSLLLFTIICLEPTVMFALLALTKSPELALVTARLRFIGLTLIPFGYLLFVAEFTDNTAWINRKTVLALLIIPLMTQLVIWDVFGEKRFYASWIFIRYDLVSNDVIRFAGWYWVAFVYIYGLIGVATVMLFRFARRAVPFRRQQAIVIAVGATIAALTTILRPFAGNLPLNPVPPGLMVWALACSWVVLKQRLLDVIPVAYHHIFHGTHDGVIVLNNDRLIVQINRAAEAVLKQPAQAVIGKRLSDLPLLARWSEHATESPEEIFEHTVPQMNSPLIYEVTNSALVNEDAVTVGQLVMLRDITERKRVEENLRHRNEYLTALQQVSFDLLKRQPIDHLLQLIVDRATSILNAPYGELMLHENNELAICAFTGNQPYLKDDRAIRGEAQLSWQAFDTRQPVFLDDYQTWPGHRTIYDEVKLRAVADFPIVTGDDCLGVLAIGRSEPNQPFKPEDIQNGVLFSRLAALALDNARLYDSVLRELGERRKIENALRDSENRLKYILSNAPVILMSFGIKSGSVFVSESANRITGYPPEVYRNWNAWMSKVHPDDIRAMINYAAEKPGDTTKRAEYRFLHADGTYRWVSGEGRLVLDETGSPLEYIAYAVDITEQKQTDEALRASEERYRQLLEHVPVALAVLDIETFDMLYINPAFRQVIPGFGSADPDSLVELIDGFRVWMERLTPDSRQLLQYQLYQLKEPTRPIDISSREYTSTNPNGSPLHLRVQSVLTQYNHRPALLVAIDNVTETRLALQDEAEQRRFTEALLDSAIALNSTLRFQEVLDKMFSNLDKIVTHARINVMMIEDEYARVVGWRGYTELEIPIVETINFMIRTTPNMRRMVETREPLLIEDTLTFPPWRSNIGLGEIRSYLGIPIVSGTDVIGFINLDSKQPAAFQPKDAERLKAFAAQIAIAMANARLYEHVQEEAAGLERQRLARELHDAVSQTLFSASVTAEALARLVDSDPEFLREGLAQLVKLTRGALSEMRALLVELRPSALQESELSLLLTHLVNSFKTRTSADTDYIVEGEPLHIPTEQKISLYRIAQEALNNIVKHSHAHHVMLQLSYTECCACLHISDDGVGFNPETTLSQHFGVHIMRERAALVGIDFTIQSASNQGTVIEAIWEDKQLEQ